LTEQRIPHSWAGQTVYVGLLVPTRGDAPADATLKVGWLHEVNDLGILGTFSEPNTDEEPMRAFYPWGAVLSISNMEDAAEVIDIR